jgi:hypothetical protein
VPLGILTLGARSGKPALDDGIDSGFKAGAVQKAIRWEIADGRFQKKFNLRRSAEAPLRF